MCVQYRGAYYLGGGSVPWGISYKFGGYLEYRGDVQYRWECNLLLFEYLHGNEHPHGTQVIPHGTEHTLYRMVIWGFIFREQQKIILGLPYLNKATIWCVQM